MAYWQPQAVEQRFWERVNKDAASGCWLWTAGFSLAYGVHLIGPNHRRKPAHKFAYELLVGPVPDGLELDHLCRNPACVNPAHLEAVTHAENVRRGSGPTAENARKTRCPAGHEFTPANTYVDNRGQRSCKQCRRDRRRRLREAALR